MASYYTSSLAPGGGSGTQISPFTFAELVAFISATAVAGDQFWVKNDGTYSVAAYTISKAGGSSTPFKMSGYTSVIGDGGVAVLLRSSGAGTFANHTGVYWIFENLSWDSAGTGTATMASASSHYYLNCKIRRGGTLGNNGGGIFINCLFELNGQYGSNSGAYFNCQAITNGTLGFSNPVMMEKCIAANNGTYGVTLGNNTHVSDSVCNANAGGGLITTAPIVMIKNSIFSNHPSGNAIQFAAGSSYAYGCNFWGNASDTNAPANLIGKKTVDPQYNNAGALDFRRAGSNLDGQGYGIIGLGFDYEQSIGPSPKVLGGSSIPIFTGITALSTSAEGSLIAAWSAGTGTINYYEVYIKAGTATGLFDAVNMATSVANTALSAKVKFLQSGVALDIATTYYVGVKARNFYGIDTNTASLNAIPSDNINAQIALMQGTGFSTGTHSLVKIRERLDEVYVATGVPQQLAPQVATRVIGTNQGGTVADMAAHDEVSYATGEVVGTGLEVIVERTTSDPLSIPSLIRMEGYYNGSASHSMAVQVYNFITAAWDSVATMVSRTSAFSYTIPLNSDNHDAVGLMRIRFLHNVTTYNASHRLYLDYLSFEKVATNSALASDVAAIKAQTDQMSFDLLNNVRAVKNATDIAGVDFSAVEKASITTSVSGIPADVWSYVTRTITSGGITAAEVWDYLLTAITTTGSIGKLLKDNVDAAISAVKAKTDNLPALPANEVTSQSILAAIANLGVSTRISDTIPADINLPSVVTPIKGSAYLKDNSGVPQDPWANQLTVRFIDSIGARVDNGLLYADVGLTTLLIDGPANLDYGALLIRDTVGEYHSYIKTTPSMITGNLYRIYEWYDSDPGGGAVKQSAIFPFSIIDAKSLQDVIGEDLVGILETDDVLSGSVEDGELVSLVDSEVDLIGILEEC